MKNRGPKFDIDDGDFIFGDNNIGFDSEGHPMMDMSGNMSMDMETGDIHFTSGGFNNWNDEDEKDW